MEFTVGQEFDSVVEGEDMIVLVTGAAGFIGSHTADALLTRGNRVIIVGK